MNLLGTFLNSSSYSSKIFVFETFSTVRPFVSYTSSLSGSSSYSDISLATFHSTISLRIMQNVLDPRGFEGKTAMINKSFLGVIKESLLSSMVKLKVQTLSHPHPQGTIRDNNHLFRISEKKVNIRVESFG